MFLPSNILIDTVRFKILISDYGSYKHLWYFHPCLSTIIVLGMRELNRRKYESTHIPIHEFSLPGVYAAKSLSTKIDTCEKNDCKFNGIEKAIVDWCGKSSIYILIQLHIPA